MPDGNQRIDTHSEAWRHECEVRYVAAMPQERRDEYCALVQRHRKRPVAKRLWREAQALAEQS